jgi:hypothetical protein
MKPRVAGSVVMTTKKSFDVTGTIFLVRFDDLLKMGYSPQPNITFYRSGSMVVV